MVCRSGSASEGSNRWQLAGFIPAKVVRIDVPCLDCGAPVRIEMKDGAVLKEEPKGIMGYVAVPFSKWFQRFPYA
jgi:hypothetical protein